MREREREANQSTAVFSSFFWANMRHDSFIQHPNIIFLRKYGLITSSIRFSVEETLRIPHKQARPGTNTASDSWKLEDSIVYKEEKDYPFAELSTPKTSHREEPREEGSYEVDGGSDVPDDGGAALILFGLVAVERPHVLSRHRPASDAGRVHLVGKPPRPRSPPRRDASPGNLHHAASIQRTVSHPNRGRSPIAFNHSLSTHIYYPIPYSTQLM